MIYVWPGLKCASLAEILLRESLGNINQNEFFAKISNGTTDSMQN